MPLTLFVVYTLILFYLILKLKFFRLEGLGKWTPALFFGLKLVAALALWWIYTYYYTDRQNSDIWKYYNDGNVMYSALHEHPGDYFRMLTGIGDHTAEIENTYYHHMDHWYRLFDNNLLNDAHIVIRFNAAARLFSMGNYFTHALFMCFLAFTGLCAIYKIIFPALREWRAATAGLLFLLPSLVFWSSGVMKEGLMLFGLGLLIYQVFLFCRDKKYSRIPFILVAALILLFSKFYVIVAVIPPLVAAVWVMKSRRQAALKFFAVFLFFGIAAYSVRWIAPEREPLRLLSFKQNDFLKMSRGGVYLLSDSVVAYVAPEKHSDVVPLSDSTYHIREGADYYYWTFDPVFSDTFFVKNSHDPATYRILTDFPRAGSLLKANFLQPTLSSFAAETPRALFHALFRPFVWEGKNPMLLLPALENLLLLVLLVFAVFFRRKIASPEIFGFCLGFSLLLLWVIGLTTPVLGALVRYRIAAQPFLLLAVLMLIDREKLLQKMPWLAKLGI